jgi:hypothetical protein
MKSFYLPPVWFFGVFTLFIFLIPQRDFAQCLDNLLPQDKYVFAENPEGQAPHSTNIIVNHYEEGIMYTLRRDADNSIVAGPQPGYIGLFVQGLTETTVYNVLAQNPQTGCERQMSTKLTITITTTQCTPPLDKQLIVEDDTGNAPHSTNIIVQNPQPGILYSLRLNANNTVIDGPQPGTEPLFTGEVNQTTDYNVLAHDPQTQCETILSIRPRVTILPAPCTLPLDKQLVVEDDSGIAPHSTNILVQDPQPGILYSLRLNANNTVIDGPQPGTEPLFTGEVNQTTDYNVLAHDPQTQCELVLSTRPRVTIIPNNPQPTILYPDLFSWAKPGAYMYDVQIDKSQGGRLLRFSTASTNKGAGPFELRATVESDGTTTATQRIYDDQGGYTERIAGTFVFSGHEGHNHFHFADFANYRLRAVLANNGIGNTIRTSDKISFAMMDITPYDLSLPGAPANRVYLAPGSSLDPQGVSVGWADVYDRSLGGQWIDIAGVPDGEYWLEVTIDPSDRIAESDETNNTAYLKVILKGNRARTTSEQPSAGSAIAARSISMQSTEIDNDQEEQTEQTIVAYPNPSRGEFAVEIQDDYTGLYYVHVRDLSGKTLQKQIDVKEGRVAKTHIDLNHAGEGVYILSVYYGGKTTNRKLIISN